VYRLVLPPRFSVGGSMRTEKEFYTTIIPQKENTMFSTKAIQVMLIVLIAIVFISNSFAQEWTSEQREAWKTVKKMYENWEKRDLEGYINCMHKDFSGWYQKTKLPFTKDDLKKFEAHWLSTVKVHLHHAKPVLINVIDDIAIVHFYSSSIREDAKEKVATWSKWTHTLKNENGKWLIVGVHGGRVSE
jgi:hypothetical protein